MQKSVEARGRFRSSRVDCAAGAASDGQRGGIRRQWHARHRRHLLNHAPIRWLPSTSSMVAAPAAVEVLLAKVIAADPDSAPLRLKRAHLNLDRYRFADAVGDLERALSLDATLPRVRPLLDRCYNALGRHPEAIPVLAPLADPDFERARALLALDRLAEAEREFGLILSADPHHRPACRHLCKMLRRAGRLDELLETCERLAACGATHAQLFYIWSTALVLTGQDERAASLLLDRQRIAELELPLPDGFADRAEFNAALAEELLGNPYRLKQASDRGRGQPRQQSRPRAVRRQAARADPGAARPAAAPCRGLVAAALRRLRSVVRRAPDVGASEGLGIDPARPRVRGVASSPGRLAERRLLCPRSSQGFGGRRGARLHRIRPAVRAPARAARVCRSGATARAKGGCCCRPRTTRTKRSRAASTSSASALHSTSFRARFRRGGRLTGPARHPVEPSPLVSRGFRRQTGKGKFMRRTLLYASLAILAGSAAPPFVVPAKAYFLDGDELMNHCSANVADEKFSPEICVSVRISSTMVTIWGNFMTARSPDS